MLGEEVQLAVGHEYGLAVEVPNVARMSALVRIAYRQIAQCAHSRNRQGIGLVHHVDTQIATRVAIVADIGDVQDAFALRDVLPVEVRGTVDDVAFPVFDGNPQEGWAQRRPLGIDGEQPRPIAAVVVHPIEVAARRLHDAADLAQRVMG